MEALILAHHSVLIPRSHPYLDPSKISLLLLNLLFLLPTSDSEPRYHDLRILLPRFVYLPYDSLPWSRASFSKETPTFDQPNQTRRYLNHTEQDGQAKDA